MGDLRASEGHLGHGLEVDSGYILGSILGHSRTISRPLSEKPHKTLRNAFIWPWVGSEAEYV